MAPIRLGPLPFIYLNEAAERFCFYGARAVLVLYLGALGFNDGQAISIYSYYIAAAYFAPLIGGYVSDVYLGRFNTIVLFNAIYLAGLGILAGTAFLNSVAGCAIGLTLTALGTGGIKPNVGVFGADQLGAADELTTSNFWGLWYAAINTGAMLSYILTPLVREAGGYGWAFLLSLFTLAASVIVFLLPARIYVRKPASGVSVYAQLWAVAVAAASVWDSEGALGGGLDRKSSERVAPGDRGALELAVGNSHGGGRASSSSAGAASAAAASADRGEGDGLGISRESTPLMRAVHGTSAGGSRASAAAFSSSIEAGEPALPPPPPLLFPLALEQHRRDLLHDELAGDKGAGNSDAGCSTPHAPLSEEAAAAAVKRMLADVAAMPAPSLVTFLCWGPCGCGPCIPRVLLSCCGCGRQRRGRRAWTMESARGVLPDAFVDGGSSLLGITPLFLCLPLFWALHDAQDSIWQVQRKHMDLCISSNFCLTTEQLGVVNPILCVIFVPTMVKVCIPAALRVGVRPTPLRRMAIGMQVAAASYLLAAAVQHAIDTSPENSVPVLWQLGQITVVTVAEMLVSASGLEFAYSEAPREFRGTIMALFFASSAIGDTISGTLYAAFSSVLSPIQLLFLLSGLMCIAGVVFAVLAIRYQPLHRGGMSIRGTQVAGRGAAASSAAAAVTPAVSPGARKSTVAGSGGRQMGGGSDGKVAAEHSSEEEEEAAVAAR